MPEHAETAPPPTGLITGASLNRVVSFSDGVVAVAITVLVLPLVSLGIPDGATSPLAIITDNWSTFFSYLITFAMVFILWQGHHRVFGNFIAIDGPIMWLNGLWLLTIGFLPWPSRLIDVRGAGQDVVWLYCLTLCLNALILHAIYQHGRTHRTLLKDPRAWDSWLSVSLASSGVFAVLTVVSLAWPAITFWLLWIVIPVRFILQQDGPIARRFYQASRRA